MFENLNILVFVRKLTLNCTNPKRGIEPPQQCVFFLFDCFKRFVQLGKQFQFFFHWQTKNSF